MSLEVEAVSRSMRRTPIAGWSRSGSEKWWKRMLWGRNRTAERRVLRGLLLEEFDPEAVVFEDAGGKPWTRTHGPKEGKTWHAVTPAELRALYAAWPLGHTWNQYVEDEVESLRKILGK